MSDSRTHAPLSRWRTARHAVSCVLVLALVWAQSMGLWHRVVHWDAPHTARAGMALPSALHVGQTPKLMQRLFAGHLLDTDCQFFDQHSHGDLLSSATAATVGLALSAPVLVASHALAVARWHALFQARGPPSLR